MQERFHSSNGIAYPRDLQLLTEIFDCICKENGFEKGSSDAEDIGRAAMSLFAAGVFDEPEIKASLAEYIKRKKR